MGAVLTFVQFYGELVVYAGKVHLSLVYNISLKMISMKKFYYDIAKEGGAVEAKDRSSSQLINKSKH